MPEELRPGARGEVGWTVEAQHCTRRGEYDIFSTPAMVMLLETAAMEAMAPFLGEGQGSVGSSVAVRHLAPTLKGMRIRAVATVREVDRRRVAFDVEVWDDVEKVGEADHERFVVDLDRYERRLDQKRASVGG
jgi:predicted thioesterase